MIELTFAIIGAGSVLWFLYLLGQEAYYKRYYKGILEQMDEVLLEVSKSDKESYSKNELSDILYLLSIRRLVSKGYFEKKDEE